MSKIHSLSAGLALGAAVLALCFTGAAEAQTPKRGGVLTLGVKGTPNTLDCHAMGTFAYMQAIAPAYSGLLRFDPEKYPKIVGDLAESWTISADGMTYTFKLKPNVKFHDGSTLTSADVKASLDRLRNPPEGVISIRQSLYTPISSIETPDANTVIVKLGTYSPIMELNFANPFTCIYSAAALAKDPKYPDKAPMGTGPYKFVELVPGASITYARFDGYFEKGQPYLDGIKEFFLTPEGYVKSLQAGQVDGTTSSLATSEKDLIGATRGAAMTFPEAPYNATNQVTINVARVPDIRVRRALNLAMDRKVGDTLLQKMWSGKGYGVLFPGGAQLDMSDAEMAKLPGFGPDVAASRAEARKLLAEAGASNMKMTLLNRNTGEPYATMGVYVVDQLRQIGINAEQRLLESAAFAQALATKDFEISIDSNVGVSGDPSEIFVKYLPGSNLNFGGYQDPVLTELFEKQSREKDLEKRRAIVTEFQKRVLDQGWIVPGFRSLNRGAMAAYVKDWTILPSPVMNSDFRQVWLDK